MIVSLSINIEFFFFFFYITFVCLFTRFGAYGPTGEQNEIFFLFL